MILNNYILGLILLSVFAYVLLFTIYLKYKKSDCTKEFTNDQLLQFNKEKSNRYSNMQNKVNIETVKSKKRQQIADMREGKKQNEFIKLRQEYE
jgi:hypothetical protein